MSKKLEVNFCNNAKDPVPVKGCLRVADPLYTMDFTDVEDNAFVHWCSACGPEAHLMEKLITKAIESQPGFRDKLEKVLDKAEKDRSMEYDA